MKAAWLSITATAFFMMSISQANTDAFNLARKSGCLACHTLQKKFSGPSWKAVSARYKNDASARDFLIEKIKKGGKGNWTSVTNGAPMPPFASQVSNQDIEILVDFILSL